MSDQQFSDELAEALKELNQVIIKSASSDNFSIYDLRDAIDCTLGLIPNSASTFYSILDRTLSELEKDDVSHDDASDIMDSLMDDLNNSDPLLRVIHNPSDQWSVVEKLSGDGYLEAIAYFSSPNVAENSLDFLSTQINNT